MSLDVRTMCLGALSEADASGYELQKNFKEGPFGHFLEASYGSIYPSLTRLTEEGLVTCSEHSQEGRPDKKVYSITEAGRDALKEALNAMPVEDKFRSEFLFFMFFSDLMDTDQISKLIDERVATTLARKAHIDETEGDIKTAGHAFVYGYGRAMVEASLKYLQEYRSLIEAPSSNTLTVKKTNGGSSASLNPSRSANVGQ